MLTDMLRGTARDRWLRRKKTVVPFIMADFCFNFDVGGSMVAWVCLQSMSCLSVRLSACPDCPCAAAADCPCAAAALRCSPCLRARPLQAASMAQACLACRLPPPAWHSTEPVDDMVDVMAVQYFDSDFSFEEHARECAPDFEHALTEASELALIRGSATNSSSECINSDVFEDIDAPENNRQSGHLHPTVQSECWDAFHSSHSHGNFFKSRRYITKCFPCLLDHPSTSSSSSPRIILEIGCGSGSSCLPIIKGLLAESLELSESPPFALLACDSSPVAVETTKRCVQEATKTTVPLAQCFNAFVADPSIYSEDTSTSLLERTKEAYQQIVPNDDRAVGNDDRVGGIADVILCVFVLSAVDPAHAKIFIRQVYESLLPGAYCCFRDYGMFDLPMMRFPPTSYRLSEERDFDDCPPRLFVRGDGTLSRFFHCETVQKLFEEAGFTTEELRYATVFNINRKTKQKLKRVFVHGIFRKPVA